MGPLIMVLVALSRSLNNSVMNIVAKTRIKSRSGHYLFATLASAVALLLIIALCNGIPEIESIDILHGIILGVLLIGEEFFLLSALECGNMTATVICALVAFGLTRIASVPLWGHEMAFIDVIFIVLAAISVLLLTLDFCNNKIRNEKAEWKEFRHWRKYALILIAITALVEIEEKAHTMVVPSTSEIHYGYFFVAFLTGTILAGGLFLWRRAGKKEATQFKWDWKFVAIFIFCGLMKGLIGIQIWRIAADWTEKTAAIINNCSLIVLIVLIDRFLFKTKLRWNHYVAAAVAILAMMGVE